MQLYLIRHGDPDYAQDSLTPAGQKQAQALAQAGPARLDLMLCSPLGRAQRTAAPLAAARGLTIQTVPWLREMDDVTVAHSSRPDLAVWNLEPAVLLGVPPRDWTRAEAFRGSGLDARWRELCDGADRWLAGLGLVRRDGVWHKRPEARLPEAAALATHLGAGLALLGHLLGVCPAYLWATAYLPPCSITTLMLEQQPDGGCFRLIGLGTVAHLQQCNAPVTWSGLHAGLPT